MQELFETVGGKEFVKTAPVAGALGLREPFLYGFQIQGRHRRDRVRCAGLSL